ncbi:MKRN2 opposite strand protein-like [Babylonia areolata]|uniref:MKRN2 opposite strand protein-like n=1 Tax=Babylonia areolata TaxID=304850 RepID=UPI003FD4BEDA
MGMPVNTWPDLKCFQHCDRRANILCCSVPPVCPLCHHDTHTTPMRIPPYVLPSPFVASHQAACSIVLKPTSGDFIRHYTDTADLHIGVTDSSGCCHDFDEEGLHVGNMWPQCVALPMRTQTEGMGREAVTSTWDQVLAQFADPQVWTVHRYHESDCNCFDFVLQFLQFVGLQRMIGERVITSKQVFCQEFLQQNTSKAARYVSLYRQVMKEGCVVDMAKH